MTMTIVSYETLCVFSVIAVLCLGAWKLLDASFSYAVSLLLIGVGLLKHPGVDLAPYRRADLLGVRSAILLLLAVIISGSLALMAYQAFAVGAPYKVIIVGVLLTAFCLTLFVGERIERACLRFRLWIQRNQFYSVAESLINSWPCESQIRSVGKHEYSITVDRKAPLALLIDQQESDCPFWEAIGPVIRKVPGQEDRICMDLTGRLECTVEYLPCGTHPTSFLEEFEDFAIHFGVLDWKSLGRSLALVQYDKRSDLVGDELTGKGNLSLVPTK